MLSYSLAVHLTPSDWLVIVTAGLAGTFLMTLFMYLLGFLTPYVLKVVKVLGTMLTFQTTPDGGLSDRPLAIGVGTVAHYAVGVLFVLAYRVLWAWGVGDSGYGTAFWFGLASGVLAIGVWYGLFRLHPRPPQLALRPYLLTIFLGHFVFVYGAFWIHNVMNA
ncbi:hypothetical protein GCM10027275_15100 [Rhabdobacter roseus]|uniref:Uncharacterized protein n=1 Tax=Rhabdobacter roseus TaxID=1655419 RepID=A0A840TTW0_9BACT|nr:hypothetical protein [Rhabdobacter roseus]MBB5283430.1 hypothetical protein [Rhabdobacter roseus]